MKKFVLSFFLLGGLAAFGQAPSIRSGGVLNAVSYASGIAQGSIFVVFGSNMGPAALVQSGAPLATTLSGTQVTFTPVAGGSPVSAWMIYTLAGQVAGVLPSTAPIGRHRVTVTYNGQTSAAQEVDVVARNYGMVSVNASGSGPAVVQNFISQTQLDLNRFSSGPIASFTSSPARAGQTLILWGTGLGPIGGPDNDGATTGDLTAAGSVRVVVGGVEITPAYAGRAPGFPGADQINFTLPANVTTGCTVSMTVRAGGRTSNVGSISIAPAGRDTCEHPSLSSAALRRLDLGERVVIGYFGLTNVTTTVAAAGLTLDTKVESVSGAFSRYTAAEIADTETLSGGKGCYVYQRLGTSEVLATGVPPTPLNAGASLTLNGPGVANKAIPRNATSGFYTEVLSTSTGTGGLPGLPGGIPGLPGGGSSGVIAAGNYTLTGPGGADIGPFSVTLRVPATFDWSNRSQIASPINRSAGLRVTWTGGSSTEYVAVSGVAGARVGGTDQNPIYSAGVFTCLTDATAGNFTVPASVLQQLPAVSGDPLAGSIGLLGVGLVTVPPNGQFSAPLTAGGTTDFALFGYVGQSAKTTGWQ